MGYFDPYIHAALPHVKNAGEEARGYAERIIARLDLILGSLESEEFLEYHPRQTFTLTAGTAVDMLQVPTGEMWELEAVSCSGGGAVISISEGADTAPRYMKLFTNADTQPAIGLIFGGGTAPTILATLNAAPVQVNVQMRRRRQKRGQPTLAVGQITAPNVSNGMPNGENPSTDRHMNGATLAPNIRGSARGDGLVHVTGETPYRG